MEPFYKRHLLPIQPTGETFFVNFNLYGSLYREVLPRCEKEFGLKKAKVIRFSQNSTAYLEAIRKLQFAKKDKFGIPIQSEIIISKTIDLLKS